MIKKIYTCDSCGATIDKNVYGIGFGYFNADEECDYVEDWSDTDFHFCEECLNSILENCTLIPRRMAAVESDNRPCCDNKDKNIWKEIELPPYSNVELEMPGNQNSAVSEHDIVQALDKASKIYDENFKSTSEPTIQSTKIPLDRLKETVERYRQLCDNMGLNKVEEKKETKTVEDVEKSVTKKLLNVVGQPSLSDIFSDGYNFRERIDNFIESITPEEKKFLEKLNKEGSLFDFCYDKADKIVNNLIK